MNEPQILVNLDKLLTERQMTLAALAEQVNISVVNLSILKNNRAKAIRFSTLGTICRVLNCTPGELLSVHYPDSPTNHPKGASHVNS